MAQDFWASSGFRLLGRAPEGLVATPEWLARFVEREELVPPAEAGPRERALHARLAADACAAVDETLLAAVEDDDARENWREFLRFRDRVAAFPSLEACYLDLNLRHAVVNARRSPRVHLVTDRVVDDWLRSLLGPSADKGKGDRFVVDRSPVLSSAGTRCRGASRRFVRGESSA